MSFRNCRDETSRPIALSETHPDPNGSIVRKRAVGFKLSEGMEVPAELVPRFKFATQKSKLAGVIRGSYFAFKGTY